MVRGNHTAHSDLDIVVLLETVPNAWRESLVISDWPIELFVHDLETLAHFNNLDCQERRPCLASMLADAVVIPEPSEVSARVKDWAVSILENPLSVSARALEDERYFLSDLIDDLRDPRPRAELIAIAARLHDQLGAFILSAHNRWSGAGKHLPRRLQEFDPALFEDFEQAFDAVFVDSNPAPLISLTERLLEPFGGLLFSGYRSDAPSTARAIEPRLFT